VQGECEGFNCALDKRAVIETHGEIFTIATTVGRAARDGNPWRRATRRWSPDGKSIALISDRQRPTRRFGFRMSWGKNAKQISDADCRQTRILWAPDSKSALVDRMDHTLRRVTLEGGRRRIGFGQHGTDRPHFPMGNGISYSKQDNLLRSRVFIQEARWRARAREFGQFIKASGANGRATASDRAAGAWAQPADVVSEPHDLPVVQHRASAVTRNPTSDVNTEADAAKAPQGGPRQGRTNRRPRKSGGGNADGGGDGTVLPQARRADRMDG